MESILGRASEGRGITRDDMRALLSLEDPQEKELLFAAASDLTRRNFGNRISLYGFVYFSTYCRNNCTFCYFRKSNNRLRYRKTLDDIVSLSGGLQDSGVNLVDLTMGEDPSMRSNGYKRLFRVVEEVDRAIEVPIMLSPGAMHREVFPAFKEAGVDWFACYQETYNRDLFSRLRVEQDFDHRLNQKRWARESGMLAEDGIMVGIRESLDDRVESISRMGETGCEQIRVMTFVPQEGTPLFGTGGTAEDEPKIIAVMRLAYPNRLIPASLDVEGIGGLLPRLRAGANVVTSIVPPNRELAGVAQKDLDIDNGHRSVRHVLELLDSAGYRASSNQEYGMLIKRMKGRKASI